MKQLILTALFVILSLSTWAQNGSSTEDIRWKPEITIRSEATVPGMSYMASFGMRVNPNWTIGFMGGHHSTYYDAYPATVYSVSANAYVRRYFHLGAQQRVSFFVDGLVGPAVAYKVTGINHPKEKGDLLFNAEIAPGIRLKLVKNVHAFIGPSFGTRTLGLHAGIGF